MRNLLKGACLWILCICMILSFSPRILYAADDNTKTLEAKNMSIDQGEAAQSIPVKKYAHTVGTDIYMPLPVRKKITLQPKLRKVLIDFSLWYY